MMVCGHGDVSNFCRDRDMVVCETWNGDIESYRGNCRVLVTDQDMSEQEYYFLKGKMLARGVELISTRYKDNKLMADFLAYQADRRKKNYGGRQPFGYRRKNGEVVENAGMMYVARRIIELRDSGMTLRDIQNNPEIHHPDGRKISVSTIQLIIKNREMYKNEC